MKVKCNPYYKTFKVNAFNFYCYFLRIRCFGGARFTMWGVLRWLNLRRYRAKLSFTKEEVELNGFEEDLTKNKDNGWVHMDGNIFF